MSTPRLVLLAQSSNASFEGRRKGLYAGQLSTWRKELAEQGEARLAVRKPGRKAAESRDKEIERLKKANTRLEKPAYLAGNRT